jgi:hypothetical protein
VMERLIQDIEGIVVLSYTTAARQYKDLQHVLYVISEAIPRQRRHPYAVID